jgi:DNA polymerase type B, organellar and viral
MSIQKMLQLIKALEAKLLKTSSLKSKVKILKEIVQLNKQLASFKDRELKEWKSQYDNVIAQEIVDANKRIEAASSKGQFMKDYFIELPKEKFLIEKDYFSAIDKFWLEIISKTDLKFSIMVRFLIVMEDTSARTLCKTEIIKNDLSSLEAFKKIIHYNINNIYEHYLLSEDDNLIKGFVFRYRIIKSSIDITNNVIRKSREIEKRREYRTVKIKNINYPLSTNTYDFGNIQSKENNLIYVIDSKKELKFEFNRMKDFQIIKVYKKDKLINTLTDYFIDLSRNLFKRVSGNITYYIQNNKIILKTRNYSPDFIDKVKSDELFTPKFYTGDIETLTKIDDEGKRYFEPYALAYYNGFETKTYYVTEFNNWKEMLIKYLNDLFKDESNYSEIYFHNLSGFDIHFMLKPLVNMSNFKFKILLKDDKFISINVSNKNRCITFKDSLLLLPSSLNNLSKSFKIESPKEIFPRKLFEADTFEADYISTNVPDYKYFNQSEVSLGDYENY